jgi:REP element-mobilizing transposase RayT
MKDQREFHCFDREAELDKRERNLPHWFQSGVAIFVTYRTIDSLPREVVARMQQELEDWLQSKGLPGELAKSTFAGRLPNHQQLIDAMPAPDQRQYRQLRNRLIHRSLDDCHGLCLLRKPELAAVVAEAILHGNGVQFYLDSFVIMPNHVHAIVQFRAGYDLSIVGQSWMRYSARRINKETSSSGAFWQPEPFDHLIRSESQFCNLQKYIAQNPQKANLSPGEFWYWEAK